jgi:glycerophosphoryl diester phosphodiesterase
MHGVLHPKWKGCQKTVYSPTTRDLPLNIAHRGARSLAPENTLAAAGKALECGAAMWELDLRMTADGELIIIHDSTLERTSNVKDVFPHREPWQVHEFYLEEIRRLDFGSWFIEQDPFGQIASGGVSEANLESYANQPAPTLREALAFTMEHNWCVNLEIKDLGSTPDHSSIVSRVVALVQELDMVNKVLISSFNHGYLTQVHQAEPNIAIAVLVSKPHPQPETLLHSLNAQAYHPRSDAINPNDIVELRQQGFQVNLWTVNDPDAMKRLLQEGVSGLVTDFPQVLRSILADGS